MVKGSIKIAYIVFLLREICLDCQPEDLFHTEIYPSHSRGIPVTQNISP